MNSYFSIIFSIKVTRAGQQNTPGQKYHRPLKRNLNCATGSGLYRIKLRRVYSTFLEGPAGTEAEIQKLKVGRACSATDVRVKREKSARGKSFRESAK